MKRRIAISTVLLSLLVRAAFGQPTADSVARRAIDVLAGSGWNDARYLAFTFNVEREGKIVASYPQRWDRFTGDYRVRGTYREGARSFRFQRNLCFPSRFADEAITPEW